MSTDMNFRKNNKEAQSDLISYFCEIQSLDSNPGLSNSKCHSFINLKSDSPLSANLPHHSLTSLGLGHCILLETFSRHGLS